MKEAARLLGCSERSMRDYLKAGAPVKYKPREGGGKPHPYIDPSEMIKWRAARGMKPFRNEDELGQLISASTPVNKKLQEAAATGINIRQRIQKMKLAKLIADTKRTNLAFEIQKGNYLPLEDVQRERIIRINNVKRGLLQMPSALAPRALGKTIEEIEQIIKDEVIRLLRQFAGGEIDSNE